MPLQNFSKDENGYRAYRDAHPDYYLAIHHAKTGPIVLHRSNCPTLKHALAAGLKKTTTRNTVSESLDELRKAIETEYPKLRPYYCGRCDVHV